ncbi:MAG: peptidylprolyl isomerase [Bacteroidales bacterium]|nr:peptidylprolyl isomerase [Bacteroidales bacterium]
MKKILFIVIAALFSLSVMAQNDPVMFEINGQTIRKSEFMRDFLRSIGQDPKASPTACTYEKRKALEDYVQLFVNYRVKLADAYAMGLDTAAELRKELASYRGELAAPYLIDSATMQHLFHEAYQRNQEAVHAAHILVNVPFSASPADTLRLYKEAMEVYRRVTTGGEDFHKVAREIMEKQMTPEQRERAAQQPIPEGHEGDLGFFTVFDMVYPFENATYALHVGEISRPIRSRYGYHIIKLIDRVPFYGNVTLRHIWISNKDDKAEGKINEAYRKIMEGHDFERVARNYSFDRRTSDKGGLLGNLTMQQLPPQYISTIGHNNMKAGDVSKPFHTEYGWHIIRVDRRDTMGTLDDLMSVYRQRLTRDQRDQSPRSVFVEQCKRQYHFVDYTQQYGKWNTSKEGVTTFVADVKKNKKSKRGATLDELIAQVDESVFTKSWRFHAEKLTNLQPLFSLNGKMYNAIDLGQYIALHQTHQGKMDIGQYVKKQYEEFIADRVIALADSRLEEENPEFRDLIAEYRHGLMIFNYNDKMVWSKSLEDTAGFERFYQTSSQTHSYDNPDDSVYFWKDRARVTTFTVADSQCIMPDKAMKIIAKERKKGRSANDIRMAIIDKLDRSNCKSNQPVVMGTEVVEDGNQTLLSKKEWNIGTYLHPGKKGYQICVVEQLMLPTLKSADEARGYYVNDFQNEMERQLTEQLRKKYNVKIHQDVIDEITY